MQTRNNEESVEGLSGSHLATKQGLFLCRMPRDGEQVPTSARGDESTLFHCLDGIAIGGHGAYYFVVFLSAQDGVTAEGISFKLVSVLDVQ